MYKLARLMLIVTIVACCFGVVIVAIAAGVLVYLCIPVAFLAFANRRKGGVYTAHGTARWATLSDLQSAGMVGAKRGPIIGRMANNAKTPLLKGLNDLFSFSVSSKVACEQFFDSIRFFNRPQRASELIRLPKAIHTAFFAPTGAGKGVSCVIPYLLTSPESTVVIDFKADLYEKTADHRGNALGHQIVALDPFQVCYADSSYVQPIGLHR